MAAANSDTLLHLVGEEYKKLEAGKEVGFWTDDEWLRQMIANAESFGGGEGDAESFKIPFEIDGGITTTVSASYKGDTNLQDVEVAKSLKFAYEWVDQDVMLYKREADLAKNFRGLVKMRLKNAQGAYNKKVLVGMLQGDGSASTVLSGFQSLWYGSTYGGQPRATYAERLDCASVTTKFNGGNGTKFTDAIANDGKTLMEQLVKATWATSINGETVTDIYLDTIAFGSLRSYLGDKYLTNVAGQSDAGDRVSAPAQRKRPRLLIEGGILIHPMDNRMITSGHCFGITNQLSAIFSATNAPLIPDGPFNQVDVPTKKGAVDYQFQGSGKFVNVYPTSCFWFTQFGKA